MSDQVGLLCNKVGKLLLQLPELGYVLPLLEEVYLPGYLLGVFSKSLTFINFPSR
jgi:hypothetical protein